MAWRLGIPFVIMPRGALRETFDLLAVEESKLANIRVASYETAIEQSFKRMRSSRSALTQ